MKLLVLLMLSFNAHAGLDSQDFSMLHDGLKSIA